MSSAPFEVSCGDSMDVFKTYSEFRDLLFRKYGPNTLTKALNWFFSLLLEEQVRILLINYSNETSAINLRYSLFSSLQMALKN